MKYKFTGFTDEEITKAITNVANWYRANAKAIREENAYAAHVTEEQKELNFQKQLQFANDLENGNVQMGFTVWQRVTYELTGECIPFLPS
jgi:hypothetical protein